MGNQLEGFKDQHTSGPEAMENKENLTKEVNHNGTKNNSVTNGNELDPKHDLQTIRIGSRTASLYLSSPSINLKPGNLSKANTPEPASRQSTKTKREKSKLIPDELKQLKPKREFTFTGYDIMADVAPPDEDSDESDDDDDDIELRNIKQSYVQTCKTLKLIPSSSFKKQLGNPEVCMKSHPSGPDGAKAMAIALVNNNRVTSLDLEDNCLFTEGAQYIAEMLDKNQHINNLNIAENLIGADGLRAIADMLHTNTRITSLDISGSGLVDNDAIIVADIIQNNKTIRELIVSHNKFCGEGGMVIGSALTSNDTIRFIDLSWNHLRGKGAMAIVASLQKNIGLRKLDISWNGYGKDECYILSQTLKENTTLKELDISNNRVNKDAIAHLLQGIQGGDGLEILRLRGNPITPELALTIITIIKETPECRIALLDMGDIQVNEAFLTVLDDMQMNRKIEVLFGHTLRHGTLTKRDADAIDYNLNAVDELFKYMSDNNYRVIDLMKWLDKDNSMSVSRAEFKQGMKTMEVPITEFQLDKMLDELDADGDGEVDFSELLAGERNFRRKLRRKIEREKGYAKQREEYKRQHVLFTIS